MQLRSDIQILRALAVLAVVLFHLQIAGFSSGFLGVDVFFVVSGFLMQSLYARDPGPLAFYQRRARRLLPVYFLTIFASLIAAYFITIPSDFTQVAEQGLYASVFASNIGFWTHDSYFGKDNFNLFLHLWSLGVEVQYYLFVPLIFWLSRKHKSVLWLLTLGSLAFCFALLSFSPKTSFFMMPARFWEFGLGMLAARHALPSPRGPAALAATLGIAACMFIPVIPEALSPITGHPGAAALLAASLTATTLLLGMPNHWFQSLPGRVLTAIGDRSYTLYLVHFPIIILWFYGPFWGTRYGAGAWQDTAILIAIMGAATWLVYRFAERARADWLNLKTAALLSALLAVTAFAAPQVHLTKFSSAEQMVFAGVTDRGEVRCGSLYALQNRGAEACSLSQKAGTNGNVLFLGDSHTDAAKTTFAKAAEEAGLQTVLPISNDGLRREHLGEEWLARVIEAEDISHIALYYAAENLSVDVIEQARMAANRADIEISFILPTPQEVPGVKLLGRMYEAARDEASPPTLPRIRLQNENPEVARYLAKYRVDIAVYDPNEALCSDEICRTVSPIGTPYYFDNGHLSLTGARMLEPFFKGMIADVKTRSALK